MVLGTLTTCRMYKTWNRQRLCRLSHRIKWQINKTYVCPQKWFLILPLQIFAVLALRKVVVPAVGETHPKPGAPTFWLSGLSVSHFVTLSVNVLVRKVRAQVCPASPNGLKTWSCFYYDEWLFSPVAAQAQIPWPKKSDVIPQRVNKAQRCKEKYLPSQLEDEE